MFAGRITRQQLIIGFLLLSLAAISWWSDDPILLPDAQEQALIGEPDFYMRGLRLHVLGEKGQTQRYISAESLMHYPQNDLAVLEQPKIAIYRGSEPAWIIEAKQGTLLSQEKLSLNGSVVIYKGSVVGNGALQLSAEAIDINLLLEQAVSDGDILVQQHGMGELKGRGMVLDLQDNRLHLQSQVRVIYENY